MLINGVWTVGNQRWARIKRHLFEYETCLEARDDGKKKKERHGKHLV